MVGGNMKKNKGFTLIEILAVVTIIGLIFILVIPKITTSLKNKKSDVDTTTTNLVFSATKLYVSDHSSKFEKTDGNVSCMPLHQLVKKGYLDGPVKNVTDDLDITNGKSVRITYNKGFKYELVDSKERKVYYCKSNYCDSDGNGYTKIEYLESTGTQYIDTGYKPHNDIKFEADFLIIDCAGYCGILGGRSSINSNGIVIWYTGFAGRFDYGSNIYSSNELNKSTKHHVLWDKNSIYLNNKLVKKFDNSNFDSSSTLTIFTLKTYVANDYNTGDDTVDTRFSKMRLYSFKLWNQYSNIVRDYIPVIDSSERPCLFDKVSKECFYNQGTGEFLWG